jgi:dolichol-phosphate mannosyltransferase
LKISVVIPAHNEEGCLDNTVRAIVNILDREAIEHEILIVNDNSVDRTLEICQELTEAVSTVRYINNQPPNGFGFAVRRGLVEFDGDAVAIVMADASDDPMDLVAGYRKLQAGYDCVFGSRFIKGGFVLDYPIHKLAINRLANWFVKTIFGLPYNDVTNAFKIYRKEVIDGVQPILSHHFNLTVELPLKAIVRGFSYDVIPLRWYNRTAGISKLKIKEMGSRYLFIVLYVWLEKHLSRGDYHRTRKINDLKLDLLQKSRSEVLTAKE